MGFTPNKAHRVLLCIGSGLTRCAGGGENFKPDNGIVSRGCASTLLRALCCVRRRSCRQRDFLRSESLSAHLSFKAPPHAPHNSSKQLWRRRMGVSLRRQKDQRLCSHRRSAPRPNNLQRFLNKSTLLCLLPILSCDAYLLFVCRGHSY